MISLRKFIASVLALPLIAKSGLLRAACAGNSVKESGVKMCQEIHYKSSPTTVRYFTLERCIKHGQVRYRIKCSCGWHSEEFVKPDVIVPLQGPIMDWHTWPEYELLKYEQHRDCCAAPIEEAKGK